MDLDPERLLAALNALPAQLGHLGDHVDTAWLVDRLRADPPADLAALLAHYEHGEPHDNHVLVLLARAALVAAPTTSDPDADFHEIGEVHFHHGDVRGESFAPEVPLLMTGSVVVDRAVTVGADWCPLLIGGALTCAGLWALNDVVVGGSVEARDAILVWDDTASLSAGGAIQTALLAELWGEVLTPVQATTHFTSDQVTEEERATRLDLQRLLAADLFEDSEDDDDVFSFAGRLFDRLDEGLPIWRKTPFNAPPVSLPGPDATELDLSGLRLPALPDGITALTELRELRLAHNWLTTLPPLGALRHLTTLDLGSNRFAELPETLAALGELEGLFAMHNQLRTLPILPASLKRCNVRDNRFEVFPEALYELRQLEFLSLLDQTVDGLDARVAQLSRLAAFELGGTRHALPAEFGELKALRALWIYDGALTELPASMGQLTELVDLTVIRHRLKCVPVFPLPRLTDLSLHDNDIETLPRELEELPSLKSLSLSKNRIRHVPDAVFALPALKSLYLQDNPIPEADHAGLRSRAKEAGISIYLG